MKDNMSNLIEDLFHGNLRLDESIHPEQDEYQEINRRISDLMKDYKTQLTENEYDVLEQADRPNRTIHVDVCGSGIRTRFPHRR